MRLALFMSLLPLVTPAPNQPDLADWTFSQGRPMPLSISRNRVLSLPGMAFGFEMTAFGPGQPMNFVVMVAHPPTAPNDQNRHNWIRSIPDQSMIYRSCGFGLPDQVAPGLWDPTAPEGDRVIFRHQLTLLPAAPNATCATSSALIEAVNP